MAHKYADGTEEMRHRTPEELTAIAEENRIAAQINKRSGKERRQSTEPYDSDVDRRKYQGDQRAMVSSFERVALLGADDAA